MSDYKSELNIFLEPDCRLVIPSMPEDKYYDTLVVRRNENIDGVYKETLLRTINFRDLEAKIKKVCDNFELYF